MTGVTQRSDSSPEDCRCMQVMLLPFITCMVDLRCGPLHNCQLSDIACKMMAVLRPNAPHKLCTSLAASQHLNVQVAASHSGRSLAVQLDGAIYAARLQEARSTLDIHPISACRHVIDDGVLLEQMVPGFAGRKNHCSFQQPFKYHVKSFEDWAGSRDEKHLPLHGVAPSSAKMSSNFWQKSMQAEHSNGVLTINKAALCGRECIKTICLGDTIQFSHNSRGNPLTSRA